MRHLPTNRPDQNVLVGIDHSDDGGAYKLTDEIALVQSLDFFTPIVDDPYTFGQIAAANALSDIYAMGASPKTVLNIVAYPIKTLGPDILASILRGSNEKVREAGAQVIGGHSIDDDEPKFGLSVTGIVHPNKLYKNIGAKQGDVLILTKPIGIGILTTAIKRNLLDKTNIDRVVKEMTTLNKFASETLSLFNPNAVTDITGFGLLGHAYEMANGSDVSFIIYTKDVPYLPKTKELAEQNVIPGGSKANKQWLTDDVNYGKGVSLIDQIILCDVVTSGGLLISMPEREAKKYIETLKKEHTINATIIGHVIEKNEKAIYVK